MSNPYETMMPDQLPDAGHVTTVRPLSLTIIAVLCVLGGLVGVLMGVVGLAQLIFSEQIAAMVTSSSAEGPMADAQATMQQESQEVTRQFFIPMSLTTVGMLLISVALIVGGIGVLIRKPWVITWLRRTFFVAMLAEVARAILYVLTQIQLMPIMERFAESLSEEAGGNQAVAQMMTVGTMVGMAMWVVWAIAKIGLMAWASRAIKSPLSVGYLTQTPS